jgi:cytochrome c oxidase cbb3-type subunit 2
VQDVYRTMTTGLSGTPMPSYRDAFPDEDRWALAYYVLALSAYTNPLTKQPLAISETDRAALNNPNLRADTPETAYIPVQPKAAAAGTPQQAATTGE